MKMGKVVRTLVGALTTTLALVSFFACSRYDSSIIDLIPSDSCAVLLLDWSTLRNDHDLKRLFNGDRFEAVLQRLAVDSSSVKSLVVFSAVNTQVKAGMLLRGSFDRQERIATLKARGWREESVDGHKVYVNGNDYAAMPQSNILFVGTREAAAAVFRALGNSR
jgi:hypothetical protein